MAQNPAALLIDGDGNQVDVVNDEGTYRLATTGKVTVQPPPPPTGGTAVQIAADDPLDVVGSDHEDWTIPNGKTFYLQQLHAGAEGDPTEKGSKITIQYYDGTSYHVVARIYLMGTSVYPTYNEISEARDGTAMTGNGTTKHVRVTRERLGGSTQELDCVVYGYTLDT